MTTHLRLLPSLAAAVALALSGSALAGGGEACRQAAEASAAASPAPAVIELAICLDTSGSMNGLIDAARTRIWDIVSDLAQATPQPKLRVAVIQYGNDGLTAENGWTSVETDLTDDLDLVSERLFRLTTNGGTEFVGRAVDRATKSLAWSADPNALKIIVVAGNESADQDQEIRYPDACRRAIEKTIVVNSIFCGDPSDPIAPAWQDVARLADGKYAAIDQNSGTVVVATPFDADLADLSAKLNGTYLPYGERGAWAASNQAAQDANAVSAGGAAAAAQRCVAKGSAVYSNDGWDLVDACRNPDFRLAAVKAEELPEAMRSLKPEERQAYVDAKARERAELQARVDTLGTQRQRFIAEELAKQAGADKAAFDRVIRDAVRAQAQARGFTFPADPIAAAPTAPSAPTATAGGAG
jgi:hypothetical protein